jgi:hypothetical protein
MQEAISRGRLPTRSESQPINGSSSTNTARHDVPIHNAVLCASLPTELM